MSDPSTLVPPAVADSRPPATRQHADLPGTNVYSGYRRDLVAALANACHRRAHVVRSFVSSGGCLLLPRTLAELTAWGLCAQIISPQFCTNVGAMMVRHVRLPCAPSVVAEQALLRFSQRTRSRESGHCLRFATCAKLAARRRRPSGAPQKSDDHHNHERISTPDPSLRFRSLEAQTGPVLT